jgi:RNA polymerase sigma-70 factor, ECF subfamily
MHTKTIENAKRMDSGRLTASFEALRGELTGYLARLVARPVLAQDLVQSTYVKAFQALEGAPDDAAALRRWLFRIATNLALDELGRHGNWRETVMEDLRAAAEGDAAFVERSMALVATPETALVAKEHLAACFACTLRSFPPARASALLLKEVYGFSLDEIGELIGASVVQVKNGLQETRGALEARYGASCALVTKQGVCHQCTELAGFFRSGEKPGTPITFADRLQTLHDLRARVPGRWHDMLFRLIDDGGEVAKAPASTGGSSARGPRREPR